MKKSYIRYDVKNVPVQTNDNQGNRENESERYVGKKREEETERDRERETERECERD